MKSTAQLSHFGSYFFAGIALAFSFLLLLHKPLPPGFLEKSVSDRLVLHVFEPFTRAVYYYPSQLFHKLDQLENKIYWTRHSLDFLSRLLGPVTVFDQSVTMKSTKWGGVSVKTYQPVKNATGGAVVFIHGGGFAFGSVEMYNGITWRMAKEMNTFLVSIDYRRVPEAVYPENLHDCEIALEYLITHGKEEFGIDTSKIIMIGDSAGGNLVTTVIQRRVLAGKQPEIAGQVLLYPLLQMADTQLVSYRYFHKRLAGYAFVDPESVTFYSMLYAGIPVVKANEYLPAVLSNGHLSQAQLDFIDETFSHRTSIESTLFYNISKFPSRSPIIPNSDAQKVLEPVLLNPDIFPIFRKDLSGMPKSFVITCEYDTLRDEGMIYAKRLEDAGVPTKHVNYKHGFHAMLNMHNEVSEASNCLEDIMQWALAVIAK